MLGSPAGKSSPQHRPATSDPGDTGAAGGAERAARPGDTGISAGDCGRGLGDRQSQPQGLGEAVPERVPRKLPGGNQDLSFGMSSGELPNPGLQGYLQVHLPDMGEDIYPARRDFWKMNENRDFFVTRPLLNL